MGYLMVDEETNISKKLIARIYDFFLFHCPIERSQRKGIPLSEYGWVDRSDLKQLRNRVKQLFNGNYYPKKNRDEIKNYVEENLIYDENQISVPNSIVLFNDNLGNQVQSLLYHIRNALAHSGFNIQLNTTNQRKTKIIFEDIDSNHRGATTAIISANVYQLLQLKEIIENGPANGT